MQTTILLAAALLSQTRLTSEATLTIVSPWPLDARCATEPWVPSIGEAITWRNYLQESDTDLWDGPGVIEFRGEQDIKGVGYSPPFYGTAPSGNFIIDSMYMDLSVQAGRGVFVRRDLPSEDQYSCTFDLVVDSYEELTPGDANRDGLFDSADMIAVFQAGQYEDGVALNSTWTTGDWNADAEFDSGDLVVALQTGLYEKQPGPVVPEPSCLEMALALSLLIRMRPNRSGQASVRHSPRFATNR